MNTNPYKHYERNGVSHMGMTDASEKHGLAEADTLGRWSHDYCSIGCKAF
ncbi:MAG: hypothetical protein GY924_01290 [Planctomycetaceae bacterium]|nr:hypothetical protein [Planctomycetaceae bacterium]